MIIGGILGLLALLFGFRAKKVAFFIVWFLLGYELMTTLMPTIDSLSPAVAESSLYQVLLPIAGGIILSFMGGTIEKVCVSLLVFGLTMLVGIQYFGTSTETLAISAVVGLVLAVFATAMMKPAIIIATAGIGSYMLTMLILSLTGISQEIFYFPLLIGLAACGAVFQIATTKGQK